MKIGIIGAGQIGGTLTRRLRALGHEVHVANSRDPSTLASLVTETGAVAVEAKDACDDLFDHLVGTGEQGRRHFGPTH